MEEVEEEEERLLLSPRAFHGSLSASSPPHTWPACECTGGHGERVRELDCMRAPSQGPHGEKRAVRCYAGNVSRGTRLLHTRPKGTLM